MARICLRKPAKRPDWFERMVIYMNEFTLGWTLMGYGLVGVFITLAVFMLSIRLLVKLFPEHKEGELPEELTK